MLLFFLYCVSLFLLVIFCPRRNNRPFWIVLTTIIIGLFWGFSLIDAPDIPGYQLIYETVSPFGDPRNGIPYHYEIVFLYLCKYLKAISSNFYFLQGTLFILELILVVFGFIKLDIRGYRLVASMCLLGFFIETILLGALRQGIVISVFIFSLHFLAEKKYVPYIIACALASLFHRSGLLLILIPLWCLALNFVTKRKGVMFAIFLVCNAMYLLGFSFSGFMGNALTFIWDDVLGSESTLSEYAMFVNSGRGYSNFGFLKILEVDFCYVFTFFLKNNEEDDTNGVLPSLFVLFFLLNLTIGGIVIHRITYYLQIPYYLLLFRAFSSAFKRVGINDSKIVAIIIFLYVFIFYCITAQPFSINAVHEYHLLDLFV